jgi:integrase
VTKLTKNNAKKDKMTIDTKLTTDDKPRFTVVDRGSSRKVTASLNAVNIKFKLFKRPSSPNWQGQLYVNKKRIPKSTDTPNFDTACEVAATYFAKYIDAKWTTETCDVALNTERKAWASAQCVINAFETAAKDGKIKTKFKEQLSAKSIYDYPAALRQILGVGAGRGHKGRADVSHITLAAFGELTDDGECKILDDYRRRVLSDGEGGELTCGPTYEKRVGTYNSTVKKAKALFSDRYTKAAYGRLNIPTDAVKVFRESAGLGVAKVKAYSPPPLKAIHDLDAKLIALRDAADFSKEDAATDLLWNCITLYLIARNSGLRFDELLHLDFGSFFEARKTIVDAETQKPKTVDVVVVAVRTCDPYSNGSYEQKSWRPKGKKIREVTVPRFLLNWVRAEQKRRNAKPTERIVRGQHRWKPNSFKQVNNEWWSEVLLADTEAANYFTKKLHELRALYGCEVVTATGSLHKAQIALGHASVQVTEQHYAHLLTDCVFTTNIGA